ncbi:MAG: aminotransferase class V-fold PLP-dependent enzyme [Anaerolineae bacterium]|nr:aminotransferase class V-fold PLP-dependent enzyme [Anaerolineae bacterium]
MFSLTRVRMDTPGCENVIHFNNAGAALMPNPVVSATVGHLYLESQIGGYEAAAANLDKIERAYDAAASLIGCSRDEIAITENATRAWDMAFYSIPFQPGDRILTCTSEYASNYIAFLQVARRTGAVVELIPNDQHGQVSVWKLQEMMDEKVKLIAINHIPTNGGLINPAEEIGQVAREAGVLYLLDACQSIGQIPVYVEEIGCDFLSATSRKYLRGPRGVGFLYVYQERISQFEPPMVDLQAADWVTADQYRLKETARRFETWESNVAGRVGFAAALDYLLDLGIEDTSARLCTLAENLRQKLASIPGVTGQDLGEQKGGIVTFTVADWDAAAIKQKLAEQKINVSISTPFSARLDMEERNLPGVVRASLHYYNSEPEIETFCTALENLLLL